MLKFDASEKRISTILFLLLGLCFSYFLPRWADWSQNSRLDLTLAIVDEGSLSIDSYYKNTGDYALFEGHHYLDKAPGPSLLAVPIYWAARPILQSGLVQGLLEKISNNPAFAATLKEDGTGLLKDKLYIFAVLCLVTFFTTVIPSALLGVILYRFLSIFKISRAARLAATLIYALATPAFTYSGAFYSHQLVSFLLFGAFFLAYLLRQGQISKKWLLAVGLMLGFAIISEYPAALIAGAIFFYAAFQPQLRRSIWLMLLGGLLPGLLLAGYDLAIFHTPLPVGYNYSENYTEIHSVGLISISLPTLDALWGITFGSFRGLFFVSPVLLASLAGFWLWLQRKIHRAEWGVCVWSVAAFILFNSSSVMWQGGYSVGPRYLVPMLAFMAIGLGGAFAFIQKRWFYWAVTGITAWSAIIVWAESIGGQSYPDWTANPLFQYSLPNLINSNIARNLGMLFGLKGWSSLLPIFGGIIVLTGLLAFHSRRAASDQLPASSPGTSQIEPPQGSG